MVNAWQRSVLLVAPGGAKNPVSGVQLPYMHIQDQPHARTHRRRGQPSSCMMPYKLTEACKEDLGLLRPRPSEMRSSIPTTDHVNHISSGFAELRPHRSPNHIAMMIAAKNGATTIATTVVTISQKARGSDNFIAIDQISIQR